MEKIKKFVKEHKLLVIGIVLYIVMYIFSQNFNPWQTESRKVRMFNGNEYLRPETDVLSIYMPSFAVENRILDKIPLSILYFGISDAAEAVNSGISVLFALITYSSVAMGYFMDRYYDGHSDIKKPERWIIAHLYDNVLFYIVSIAIRLLQPVNDFVIDNIDNFFPWLDDTFNGNTGLKLLGVVVLVITLAAVLLFVAVPMLPSVLYFFGYIAVLNLTQRLIETVDSEVFGKIFKNIPLPGEIFTFITAIVLIMVLNIITEQIYELIQGLSIKPAYLTVNGLKKGISVIADKFRRN